MILVNGEKKQELIEAVKSWFENYGMLPVPVVGDASGVILHYELDMSEVNPDRKSFYHFDLFRADIVKMVEMKFGEKIISWNRDYITTDNHHIRNSIIELKNLFTWEQITNYLDLDIADELELINWYTKNA